MRRPLCPRCSRPTPSACLCPALPERRIRLRRCQVLVLQHPHEQRRVNRSLPFLQLCLDEKQLHVHVARKLTMNDEVYVKLLRDSSRPCWLLYPDLNAKHLSEALRTLEEEGRDTGSEHALQDEHHCRHDSHQGTLVLLFIDATWKFAREMIRASSFPSHVQRVQLTDRDTASLATQPRRFDIRTPPSESHFSTAECVSLVLAQVEKDTGIYETIMRPLDLMVSQWHAYASQSRQKRDKLLVETYGSIDTDM